MNPWTSPKSVQSTYSQSGLTGLTDRGWSPAVHSGLNGLNGLTPSRPPLKICVSILTAAQYGVGRNLFPCEGSAVVFVHQCVWARPLSQTKPNNRTTKG